MNLKVLKASCPKESPWVWSLNPKPERPGGQNSPDRPQTFNPTPEAFIPNAYLDPEEPTFLTAPNYDFLKQKSLACLNPTSLKPQGTGPSTRGRWRENSYELVVSIGCILGDRSLAYTLNPKPKRCVCVCVRVCVCVCARACVRVDSARLNARGCTAPRDKGARRLQHASGSTANLTKSSIPKHPPYSAQEPNGGLEVTTCKAFITAFHHLPFQKLVLSLSSSAAQATREANAF